MAEMEFHVSKMVGRDIDGQLQDSLHASVKGKGALILISGEAGIGKTRVVQELEAYAESLGVKVLEGRCLYESPTPFLAFREALRSIFWEERMELSSMGWFRKFHMQIPIQLVVYIVSRAFTRFEEKGKCPEG